MSHAPAHHAGHGYKIKRLAVALTIIFVLKKYRIREMAPPSDLGQRRITLSVNEYDQRRSFANDETVSCTVSRNL